MEYEQARNNDINDTRNAPNDIKYLFEPVMAIGLVHDYFDILIAPNPQIIVVATLTSSCSIACPTRLPRNHNVEK
jgi:hypothetical protein